MPTNNPLPPKENAQFKRILVSNNERYTWDKTFRFAIVGSTSKDQTTSLECQIMQEFLIAQILKNDSNRSLVCGIKVCVLAVFANGIWSVGGWRSLSESDIDILNIFNRTRRLSNNRKRVRCIPRSTWRSNRLVLRKKLSVCDWKHAVVRSNRIIQCRCELILLGS